jgi:glycosyltransferase involved in cell wall biosynthesis
VTLRRHEIHLAVSDAVRASLPVSVRKRTRVVRHGINTDAVRDAADARVAMRAALGVEADDLVIGTVANLRRTKGYPDLMRAARRVLDAEPRARFLAVGRGPLEAELRALHAELGLGTRFELLGHRPDAIEVMSAFDVFCLPSRHEGLPISLMEALALGLPIVATRAGGIEELVANGREATLVAPEQPERMADALIAVLQNDVRRAEMARLSYARGNDLDVERTVVEIEAVYREAVRT